MLSVIPFPLKDKDCLKSCKLLKAVVGRAKLLSCLVYQTGDSRSKSCRPNSGMSLGSALFALTTKIHIPSQQVFSHVRSRVFLG